MNKAFVWLLPIILASYIVVILSVVRSRPNDNVVEEFRSRDEFTLEELEMCGEGPLNVGRSCDDRTCKTCLQSADRFKIASTLKEFAGEFENPTITTPILKYVTNIYGKAREGLIIVLLVADHYFMDFVVNWHLKRDGTMISSITFGTDERAMDLAISWGLHVAPITWKTNPTLSSGEEYWDNQYRIWFVKALQIHLLSVLVSAGYSVLLQDADAFWMRDPRPYLLSMARDEGAEIQTQLAPRWDRHGVCNSGFIFVSNHRNSHLVPNFFKSLSKLTPLLLISSMDQPLWNGLFRHWKYREINLRVLPYEKFRRINRGETVLPETIVAHRVSGNKTEKINDLKVYDLWLFENATSA